MNMFLNTEPSGMGGGKECREEEAAGFRCLEKEVQSPSVW